jgi:hypothetical protein
MAMPDMRTASVASANEENLAAAVTIRSMTDELKACSSRPRAVRRGEKVPTAVGTVGDAFDLLDLGSLGSERAGVGFGGTELSAGGTGLLGGELVGLLFEEQLEGSLGQSLGGGGGDLLEGSEVDIESGSVVAEGPPVDRSNHEENLDLDVLVESPWSSIVPKPAFSRRIAGDPSLAGGCGRPELP